VIRKMGYDTSCDVTKTLLKTWEEEKWMNIRNAKAEFLGKIGGGDGTVDIPLTSKTTTRSFTRR